MKRKILNVTILFLAGIFMFSCSKDDSCTPQYQGTMNASISGNWWNATSMSATNDGGTISIGGYADNGSYISIFLPAEIAAGSQNIDRYGSYNVTYVDASDNFYDIVSGTMNISSVSSNEVRGSFSGSAPGNDNCNNGGNISGSFDAYF